MHEMRKMREQRKNRMKHEMRKMCEQRKRIA
jgi:hypothetical protein